jgi:Protein of unknown function (DUF2946)
MKRQRYAHIVSQRMSRWLLVLAVCWQGLMIYMPIAQAKTAAGEGGWETICTMSGASKVWVESEADRGSDSHESQSGSHCPLCLMSNAGLAPPPEHASWLERRLSESSCQFEFNTSFLTRTWSEQARGPPASL